MPTLTAKAIESLRGTNKRKAEKVAGGGSLVARGLTKSISLTYVYSHDGNRLWQVVGEYSRDGDTRGSEDATKYTLAGARRRAQALAALADQVGDLKAYTDAERIRTEREHRQTMQNQLIREQEAATHSFAALCEAYLDHLDKQGKPSARDARNTVNRWVIKKQPALAAIRASEITTDDIMVILKAVIHSGKTTTVNRLRTILLSAFNHAASANYNLLADSATNRFNITNNPVAIIPAVQQYNRAGNRFLTDKELGIFMRKLSADLHRKEAKVVMLSIRLGAQRIQQLLAANDYDHGEKVLTLFDIKGRRLQARPHTLPVPQCAEDLLVEGLLDRHPRRDGMYGGIRPNAISGYVRAVGDAMAEESGGESFKWQDIRRTIETLFSSMGISKDVRAQIQSHGISGVQAKHYDRHDYMPEKRATLAALNAKLEELQTGVRAPDNVVSIVP